MSWCEKCAGTGKISCGACWGGQRKPVCPDCLGKGVIEMHGQIHTCGRCRGLGKISPQSCPSCGNSTLCPACSGKGEC